MSHAEQKRALRRIARKRRIEAAAAAGRAASEAIGRAVLAGLGRDIAAPAGCVVSGFWPMADEPDITGLLAALHERGHVCALPCVPAEDGPLAFRRWTPGDALRPAVLGIMEPATEAEAVTPRIVLTPLLAFDAAGYRLGQGKGYYDRTLAALRAAGPVTAVGIAFAAQRVDAVPREAHDARLDWIATEDGLRRVSG